MTDALIAHIFAASPQVRCLAVYAEPGLHSQGPSDLRGAGSSETEPLALT